MKRTKQGRYGAYSDDGGEKEVILGSKLANTLHFRYLSPSELPDMCGVSVTPSYISFSK